MKIEDFNFVKEVIQVRQLESWPGELDSELLFRLIGYLKPFAGSGDSTAIAALEYVKEGIKEFQTTKEGISAASSPQSSIDDFVTERFSTP